MLGHLKNAWRLLRAVRTLAAHDALKPLDFMEEMPPGMNLGLALARIRMPWEPAPDREGPAGQRLAKALEDLGPSYIKLGQFLATRPDIIGVEMATDLEVLRDHLPPFPRETAVAIIEAELEAPLDELFAEFSEPIAAASIAQVHKARTLPTEEEPEGRTVAVKVLRPEVEQRFAKDLESYFWAARMADRFAPDARRLRPIDVVETLAESVRLEMDFRIEAAASSEMAENIAEDVGFRVPGIDWQRTSRRVLAIDWVGGIPAAHVDEIRDAGHDLERLARLVIQSFLLHAMRDGFFHADMHQGNLFVADDGSLVAVDFGIMGRLDRASRRYLADILYGFVERDYHRVAQLHFEAGYVPAHQNVDTFALALRSIGEPIFGKPASEVSMARLLAQLFQVTEQFDMATRPELIMLQKTMVVVEGVARSFNPEHNIWESAEPVLKSWMLERLAPEARLQEAAEGARHLTRLLTHLPEALERADRAAASLAARTDAETSAGPRAGRGWGMRAVWLVIGILAASLYWQM